MEEGTQLTALVMDDEPLIVTIVSRILHDCGVKEGNITTADSNEKGLKILEDCLRTGTRYDIVFIDLNQQPTGLEVYTYAAQIRGTTPYIMTGGARDAGLLNDAKALAGDRFIGKPFGYATIRDIVCEVTERKSKMQQQGTG